MDVDREIKAVEVKPFWESRTVWANAIVLIVGAGGIILDYREALNLPDQWAIYMTVAGAIANLFLRSISEQPVSLK